MRWWESTSWLFNGFWNHFTRLNSYAFSWRQSCSLWPTYDNVIHSELHHYYMIQHKQKLLCYSNNHPASGGTSGILKCDGGWWWCSSYGWIPHEDVLRTWQEAIHHSSQVIHHQRQARGAVLVWLRAQERLGSTLLRGPHRVLSSTCASESFL